MESPSTPATDNRGNTGNFQKSHYRKTVCLADWWLVKAENEVQGRRLSVAGISEKGQAVRVFISAPILKRFDAFTLETTDGIYVVLNGFINKTRTLEKGFPSDIFKYFLFGFPPQWKEYDEKCVVKEPSTEDIMRDKHLDQQTQQLGSMEGAQPQIGSCEKDLKSQGETEATDRRESKRAKSLGVAQPHVDSCEKDLKAQGETEATDRRDSKRAKSLGVALPKSSFSGLQKESYSGGTSVEDHTALKLPVKYLLNEDTGIREIKTRSKTRKANNKAMKSPCTPAASIKSPCTPAASIKSPCTPAALIKSPCTPVASTKSHHAPETVVTGNNSLPEKVKDLDSKAAQKSAPVSKNTPKSKKKKVGSPSPESQSLKRSRSGRLLMPRMEYWRNQRAIYDVDRTITGIKDGMHP